MCCCETKAEPNSNASNIDLVCGMRVDPATAPGMSDYENKRYFFCGAGCKRTFDADPKKYA